MNKMNFQEFSVWAEKAVENQIAKGFKLLECEWFPTDFENRVTDKSCGCLQTCLVAEKIGDKGIEDLVKITEDDDDVHDAYIAKVLEIDIENAALLREGFDSPLADISDEYLELGAKLRMKFLPLDKK